MTLCLRKVVQHFTQQSDVRTAFGLLASLTVIDMGGHDVTIQAANNGRMFHARYHGRQGIGTQIATRCMLKGLSLLHSLYSDQDFDPFIAHRSLVSVLD